MKKKKKKNGKGTARVGKRFTLYKDINDIIKIIKLFKDSDVIIHRVTETVKHGFLRAFLLPLAASILQLVISSVINGKCERGFRRARRGYIDKNFKFCSIL